MADRHCGLCDRPLAFFAVLGQFFRGHHVIPALRRALHRGRAERRMGSALFWAWAQDVRRRGLFRRRALTDLVNQIKRRPMARNRLASGDATAGDGPRSRIIWAADPAVGPMSIPRRRAGWAGCRRWLAASLPPASGAPGSPKLMADDVIPPIARVQLSAIVGEYVQAQHAGNAARTGHRRDPGFHGRNPAQPRGAWAAGQIVLVGEAVLAGNVPDITASLRRSPHQVRMPQPPRSIPTRLRTM